MTEWREPPEQLAERQAETTNRDLFFFERFLRVGGRRPWNVILAARFAGSLDEPSLRVALAALQSHHPMLGVTIVQAGMKPGGGPRFETPATMPSIGLCIVPRKGCDDWFETVAHEVDRPFDDAGAPLLRAVWLRADTTQDLVLVGDHCICDGRSMLLLMRELSDLLAVARTAGGASDEPAPPRRPGRCIHTIHDLFGDRAVDQAIRQPAKVGLLPYARSLARPLELASWIGRKIRPHGTVAPSYVLRWEMDAAVTAALSERCRQEQVTPYTALATSFLRGVRAARPKHSRNRLLCPLDLRPRVPGIGADMLFAFADTVCLSVDNALDRDFWSQARALRRDFVAGRARLDPERTLLAAERMHALSDWFVTLQLHGRARNDLMFSHLGKAALCQAAARPDAGLVPHSVLGFLSSMPWRRATAIFSLEDCDVMRFFLVAREDGLPRADAERIRFGAMARIERELAA